MPTYQYQCTECPEALEARQSFSDDALTVCPACSGRLRKVFNAVGVVFKGSGFYRNDSRPTPTSDTPTSDTPKSEPAKDGKSDKSSSEPSKGDASKATSKATSTPAATGG